VTFENPGALWLLLTLPFLLFGLGLWGWMAKKEIAEMFQLNIRRLKISQVEKYIEAGVLMSLLIVALAVPKYPFPSFATQKKTGEIALLVDVSASMAVKRDLASPNRLERVKPILYEIIDRMEKLQGVRISLHGSMNIARSLVPFVSKKDYPYLKESIRKVLSINSIPGRGSSHGRPILDVVGKFSKDETAKVIVLFSDGEAFIGATRGMGKAEMNYVEEAAIKARSEGVKVITVGIGEREGAKIPLYDTRGGFTGEYAKLQGVDFVSYLEEEGLKKIASQTGGKNFFEKNLTGLIESIEENLTLGSIEEVREEVKDYRFIAHWFLLAAIPIWIVFVRHHLLK
jgi:hypothetical protein